MDKKEDNSGATNQKNSAPFHMEPELWGYHKEKDTGTEHTTYRYHDGSKSTYTTYNDSSDKKK